MNATSIEWTDATWNPIRGCSRVSKGCEHCYAERVAHRFGGVGKPYEGLTHIVNARPVWTGKIALAEKHLLDPLKWRGRKLYHPDHPRSVGSEPGMRIFVNSMSDLFHGNVSDEWIDRIFAVMALCPQHTFQVLTKRPKRMLEYLSDAGIMQRILDAAIVLLEVRNAQKRRAKLRDWDDPAWHFWPYDNVHLGVSVEDQKTANERIPLLLQTPAAVRFISAEPLLGEIDLHSIPDGVAGYYDLAYSRGPGRFDRQSHRVSDDRLDWVIVGGESGPGARPMHPDWARKLRDQCVRAVVPFFFTQWGEWTSQLPPDHSIPSESIGKDKVMWMNTDGRTAPCGNADDLILERDNLIVRVGKKNAGATLDGCEWKEFPR